ncbi:hypothetical protein IFM89_022813 [Coptis chinensis]|uniref:Uncharacterized protein n=1 Tax=Coptis chinensis TaxID=261450 RepID=A0A835HLB7_9MAGN|nr:hypothetical protein IFM89_022813 [Coptis chinensis]
MTLVMKSPSIVYSLFLKYLQVIFFEGTVLKVLLSCRVAIGYPTRIDESSSRGLVVISYTLGTPASRWHCKYLVKERSHCVYPRIVVVFEIYMKRMAVMRLQHPGTSITPMSSKVVMLQEQIWGTKGYGLQLMGRTRILPGYPSADMGKGVKLTHVDTLSQDRSVLGYRGVKDAGGVVKVGHWISCAAQPTPLLCGEKKHYDHKVDIYSFSIVLWELLTNLTPLKGMTIIQAAYVVASRVCTFVLFQRNSLQEIWENRYGK